jgi:hypothetical protein
LRTAAALAVFDAATLRARLDAFAGPWRFSCSCMRANSAGLRSDAVDSAAPLRLTL